MNAGDRHAVGTDPIADDIGPGSEGNDELAHGADLGRPAAFGKIAQTVDGRSKRDAERFRIRSVAVGKPGPQAFEISPNRGGDNDPPHRSALLSEVQQPSLYLLPRHAARSIGLIADRFEFAPIGWVTVAETIAGLAVNGWPHPRRFILSEAGLFDGAA